jgi:hypothetical protein
MIFRFSVALFLAAGLAGCEGAGYGDADTLPLTGDAALIAEAESAAPAAIARHATIMAWPETTGGEMRMLREGTNGWVCYPSTPTELGEAAGEDPMCFDGPWQAWANGWIAREAPRINALGIAYMLQGDRGASNTDPFATGPTPDNEWVVTGPHVMIVVPDPSQLEGLPHDPASGGPYVMWRGTPWAHIMVPVSP